jgi:thiol:disulfide interchange protein DsbA
MIKQVITLLFSMAFAFSVNAAQFEEGKHFQILDTEKSKKPVVTEYFSFYCPHCYQFEGVVKNLKPTLPEGASFEKVHVSFMGGAMGVPMAKSYATMVALDVENEMIPAMFRQIHELRQPPKDEAALRQLFVDYGVDGKRFDSAYNGFVVDSMQRKFDKRFKQSTFSGVPGVLVNNKYIVKADHIKTYDEYNELVNYLLAL